VSEILKGRRVRDVTVLEWICDGLGVPRELMGLSYGEPDAYGGDSTVADLPRVDTEMLHPHLIALGEGVAVGAPVAKLGELLKRLELPPDPGTAVATRPVVPSSSQTCPQRWGGAGAWPVSPRCSPIRSRRKSCRAWFRSIACATAAATALDTAQSGDGIEMGSADAVRAARRLVFFACRCLCWAHRCGRMIT
jgi:hypothetical protein